MDALLNTQDALDDDQNQFKQSVFNFLKTDPGRTSLKSIFKEVAKLGCIRDLGLPTKLFANVPPIIITDYRRWASAETPRELRRHPAKIRYTLVAAFCWQRNQEITDSLVELLIQIIHRIYVNAERRIGFTNHFKNTGVRSNLDRETLQRRLLLCLYGLGSNTGLKRMCGGINSDLEYDLRYVKKHYIHREHLRNAIAEVVNATFNIRKVAIWGEGTTACASDSKKFGSWERAFDDRMAYPLRRSGSDDLLAR